ncbi:-Protein CyaY [Babesia bigemina]|uniref:-Protein CyaY n=1 Tax=Babesia bigemina TaxID=5866 RepID=A0A061DDN8_BABBI|nr:-Protein CyaY [Babesia bigemina]CDR97574.1 -Protein CyaY [Babesia bigemina]|eukprot:XP_012769760.1 -Protein CyaY [Babesia bigemina]
MLRLYRLFSGVANLHRFNEAALNQLQALHDTLETVDDISSISFDGTVLTAEIDPKQYIVLNKHEASQQIWYSSFNGVDYFDIEDGKWLSRRTGRHLDAVLKYDVQQATGKAVDFANAED